jgi:hypothetical protein
MAARDPAAIRIIASRRVVSFLIIPNILSDPDVVKRRVAVRPDMRSRKGIAKGTGLV